MRHSRVVPSRQRLEREMWRATTAECQQILLVISPPRGIPLLKNVISDMLKAVMLHLVVCFQDSPDRQDMSTGEIQRSRLVEAPSISLCRPVSTGVVFRNSSQLVNKRPLYKV